MKYAVTQRYYNDGRVEAGIIEVPDDTENSSTEKENYDFYVDVFTLRESAEEFLQTCLDA